MLNGRIDYKTLINVYDRNEPFPEIKVKKLIRQRTIQDMLTEEILKLYEDNQITPDKVIKDEVLLRDLAVDKKDLTNFNKVLDKWRDSLQMLPIKNQITETYEENYVKLLEDDTKLTHKLRAKQTKQLPVAEQNEEKQTNNTGQI